MKIPIETKPALWGVAGGAVALAIVGLTWGGWLGLSRRSDVVASSHGPGEMELNA